MGLVPESVLNVDGCNGALFLDLLHSCRMFTEAEIQVSTRGSLSHPA